MDETPCIWVAYVLRFFILFLTCIIINEHNSRYVGGDAASAGDPGKRIKFTPREGQRLVAAHPDTFAPFVGMFGLSFKKEFKGTLFRFPLRDEAQVCAGDAHART